MESVKLFIWMPFCFWVLIKSKVNGILVVYTCDNIYRQFLCLKIGHCGVVWLGPGTHALCVRMLHHLCHLLSLPMVLLSLIALLFIWLRIFIRCLNIVISTSTTISYLSTFRLLEQCKFYFYHKLLYCLLCLWKL